MIDLTIIIINYNTRLLLKKCLESVFENTKNIKIEIIVVDNGSEDKSYLSLKKEFPRIKLIQNKKNMGFSAANNVGIRAANGNYVLLLNSDAEVTGGALEKMLAFAKTKNNLGVLGPRLLNADRTAQLSVGPFYTLPISAISLFRGDRFLRSSPSRAMRVDWVSGACFLISKKVINSIGLLDDNFFMYLEEMEYCYRARKAGFDIWFFPSAEVYHLVRGSSPQGKEKVILWTFKNFKYFYQKHFATWQLGVLKFLLLTKAFFAFLLGIISGNQYLKNTYGKAIKVAWQ